MIASVPQMPQSSPFTSSVEAPLASLVTGLHLSDGLKFVRQYEATVIVPKDPVARFHSLSYLAACVLLSALAISCLLVALQDYRRHAIMYVSLFVF